jgi:hypothetical protein
MSSSERLRVPVNGDLPARDVVRVVERAAEAIKLGEGEEVDLRSPPRSIGLAAPAWRSPWRKRT